MHVLKTQRKYIKLQARYYKTDYHYIVHLASSAFKTFCLYIYIYNYHFLNDKEIK